MKTASSLSALPEHPLLSVIIPSYNQGAFIRQTIESCLAQDWRPMELIIMDGGSTDGTVELLKSFGDLPELNWVSEPDGGVVDAVNRGLQKARGDIAAIQSSDDYYLPGCFSAVMDVFRAHPAAGLVFGDVERVDANGRSRGAIRQCTYSLERLLARELFVYQPTAFFRRDLALELGGWNPAIPYVPDFDLWFRLAFHSEVVQHKQVLGAYRSHPGQRDVNRDRIYENYMRMLELSRELAEAPRHLRRAAKAGAALLKFRYGGPWSHPQLTRAAWTALWYRPALMRSPLLPRHRLVPGYFALAASRRKFIDSLTRRGGWPVVLKQKIGCWLHERLPMERALREPEGSTGWLDLCNRNETVSICEDGLGRVCEWQDSSRLTACRVFPRLGGRLLLKAAGEHPFSARPPAGNRPVSIIIPLRGRDRDASLAFVAANLLAAAGPESEVLICEHDVTPAPEGTWPSGVRPLFIPAKEGEPFSKSLAMNIGARAARHPVLLLHDADAWMPDDYLSRSLEKMEQENWEAIRPVRFLFLLDEARSREALRTGRLGSDWMLSRVQQNSPGFSTLIRRDVYFELGGHDERFVGWGYEDLEFLDRLQTRRIYPGTFMPAIHLWHEPSAAKRNPHTEYERFCRIMEEPAPQRIGQARRALETGAGA